MWSLSLLYSHLRQRAVRAVFYAIGIANDLVTIFNSMCPAHVVHVAHLDTDASEITHLYGRTAFETWLHGDDWPKAKINLKHQGYYVFRVFSGSETTIVLSASKALKLFGPDPWKYSSVGLFHMIESYTYHRDHNIVAVYVNGWDATLLLQPYMRSLHEPYNMTADATHLLACMIEGIDTDKKTDDATVSVVDFLLTERVAVGDNYITT